MRDYDVEWMENNRKEQWACAKEIRNKLHTNRHCCVEAQAKSGKKEIIIAARLLGAAFRDTKLETHVFITSLNTKDTKSQKHELEENGLHVIVLKNQKDIDPAVSKINELLAAYGAVYIHFDESDYGTGVSQLFGSVYKNFKLHECTKWIYYSASNEELKCSKPFGSECCCNVVFKPAATFRESKWFIDNNLAIEAEPFWDFVKNSPTRQCNEILDLLINKGQYYEMHYNNKLLKLPYIAIVRLAYKVGGKSAYGLLKNDDKFRDFCFEKGIVCKFIDESSPFCWDDVQLYNHLNYDYKYLFVINMTGRRSTEFGCQAFTVAWHDFPCEESSFNTLAQSIGRMNHYDLSGHKIRIYGDLATMKYTAGYLTVDEYSEISRRTLSPRVKTKITPRKWKVTLLSSLDSDIIKSIDDSGRRGDKDGRKIVLHRTYPGNPLAHMYYHNDTVTGTTSYNLVHLATLDLPNKYTGIDSHCANCGYDDDANRKDKIGTKIKEFCCLRCGGLQGTARWTWLDGPCRSKKYDPNKKSGVRNWEPISSWVTGIDKVLSEKPDLIPYYDKQRMEWLPGPGVKTPSGNVEVFAMFELIDDMPALVETRTREDSVFGSKLAI